MGAQPGRLRTELPFHADHGAQHGSEQNLAECHQAVLDHVGPLAIPGSATRSDIRDTCPAPVTPIPSCDGICRPRTRHRVLGTTKERA
ncbi:hypothetical protein GCM10010399_85820 [Dactylosporangium fulvum]